MLLKKLFAKKIIKKIYQVSITSQVVVYVNRTQSVSGDMAAKFIMKKGLAEELIKFEAQEQIERYQGFIKQIEEEIK